MADRHARHRRTPLDRHRRPIDGFRTRSTTRFAQLVREAMAALPPDLATEFATVDIDVAEVPVVALGGRSDSAMVLAVCRSGDAAAATPRDNISLYRRPLETRARDRPDLRELILEVLVQQIAQLRGFDDDQLRDRGWS